MKIVVKTTTKKDEVIKVTSKIITVIDRTAANLLRKQLEYFMDGEVTRADVSKELDDKIRTFSTGAIIEE